MPGVRLSQFLRSAYNAVRVHRGLPECELREFNKLIKEKMKLVGMNPKLTSRALNEGFSGGEKKRNEVLQMAVLEPRLAFLDETDSGLDVDALRTVASGVNGLRRPDNAMVVVTHYQRLLDYIVPDRVHVLIDGRIALSGGKELGLRLEAEGYDWVREQMPAGAGGVAMTAAADVAERYRADFRAAEESSPAWLADLRKRAMERFAETGFPTARRGNEAWKYTNVSPIANADLGLAPEADVSLARALRGAPSLRAEPDGPWTTLVFVNGRFVGGSASDVAMPLATALECDASWVKAHLAQIAPFDAGRFAALNAAFLTDAAVVRIPAGGPTAAVHLVFVATGEASISHPRALLVVEPNARAAVVETHLHSASDRLVTNTVTEIEAGDGADLVHAKLVLGARGTSHIGSTTARLGRGAQLASMVYAGGADLVRNALDVRLDGEGASCRLDGLTLTHGSQHVDNQTSIEHLAPHGRPARSATAPCSTAGHGASSPAASTWPPTPSRPTPTSRAAACSSPRRPRPTASRASKSGPTTSSAATAPPWGSSTRRPCSISAAAASRKRRRGACSSKRSPPRSSPPRSRASFAPI